MKRSWSDLLRSLVGSLLEVFGAEAEALKGDLRESARQLAMVLMIAGAAAFLFFWVVGALGFVLFQVLALWLPRWGAAAIVMGVFAIVAMLLAFVARRRLLAIELPADTVRRRVEDHVAWWQDEVLDDVAPAKRHLAAGKPDPDTVRGPGDLL